MPDEQSVTVLSASAQPNSSPPIGERLPGVIVILKRGWHLFSSRLSTLFGIGLILNLPNILFEVISRIPGIEERLELVLSPLAEDLGFAVLLAVLVVVFVLATLLINFWGTFAFLYALRASEDIGIAEAYRRAWRRFASNLWVATLFYLVIIGAIALALIVPLGWWIIFALSGTLAGNSSALASVFIAILCLCAVFVMIIMLGTWFMFSSWLVVDDKARGVAALVESKKLVQGYFWPIFWRGFGVGALLGLVLLIIHLVLFGIFLFVVVPFLPLLAEPIVLAYVWVSTFVLVPLMLATTYPLYEARSNASIAPEPVKGKGWFITCAVIGTLCLLALPIVVVLLVFLFPTTQSPEVVSGASAAVLLWDSIPTSSP